MVKKFLNLITVILSFCVVLSIVLPVQNSFAEEDIKYQLENIEGVKSVTEIEPMPGFELERKFIIVFEQPIDWNGEISGSFDQRVEFAYRGRGNVNLYQITGYCLGDVMSGVPLNFTTANELGEHYKANYILPEYRYFGKSIPEGLSNESSNLWKYCTVENAAKDFHSIISKLKNVLTGKSIFTGGSKGGYTTNYQAATFSDDCEAFISYSAPFCNTLNDQKMFDYVYNHAGETAYDNDKAAQIRKNILDFQVECIKLRDLIQPRVLSLEKLVIPKGLQEFPYTDEEKNGILYDTYVCDFACGAWMFSILGQIKDYEIAFNDIPDILKIENESERADKLYNKLSVVCFSSPQYSATSPVFAYNVQAWMQMGDYYMNFDYLRNALNNIPESNGTKPKLYVTPEMQSNLTANEMMVKNLRNNLPCENQSANNTIENWAKRGTSHSMMIFGGIDPWYATAIPDFGNPSILRFVNPESSHSVQISHFNSQTQDQIWSTIDTWLAVNPAPQPTPDLENFNKSPDLTSVTPAQTGDITYIYVIVILVLFTFTKIILKQTK